MILCFPTMFDSTRVSITAAKASSLRRCHIR
ncbi:hypothetical protein EaACW_0769 [Erwinia amylovora ACW56400]|uniref:Uncharacterized protein n=1 Tax=Erwinia amylovora ATCC BAA-2158 TaxID=889211 RepID=E5B2A6_ERWAM|nr:hypothetical protein EaACW_0769 [Erwinia amylovora ACW56400]CBX79608.1 hypothetical protein predicted by Glimmer/Critica [Erwinia amylovora ATCC BAA-2158]CCO81400.1 hypothetical protein BN433_0799 [Erwinia amylovora Ea266]